MMTPEAKKILTEIITTLFSYMHLEAQVSFTEAPEEDGYTVVAVTADDKGIIGRHGAYLPAYQHIIRRMFRKRSKEMVHFLIDINGYRDEQQAHLKEIALKAAEDTKRTGNITIIGPFSPYERRLIHMHVATIGGLISESLGDGVMKKMAIKPTQADVAMEISEV